MVAKQKIKIGHREENIELIEQCRGQILEHVYLFVNFKCEKSLQTCVKIDRFIYQIPPKKMVNSSLPKIPKVIVVRAARAAKLGARAGRLSRVWESSVGSRGGSTVHPWGYQQMYIWGELTFWEMYGRFLKM